METMLDYIRETPQRFLNNLDDPQFTEELVDFYCKHQFKGLTMIASGSSYNGALCAFYYLKQYFPQVKLITPFTFMQHDDEIGNSMPLAISQSGCSTNTLEALRHLKQHDHLAAALIGRADGDMRALADLTVNWGVGEEKIGFVTKGVTTLAGFLMVFALKCARRQQLISTEEYEKQYSQLRQTMAIHQQVCELTQQLYQQHSEMINGCSKVYFLASGPAFGVAREGALKMSETSCIPAMAVEVEEFLHGPVYPADPDTLMIFIDNSEHPSSQRLVDIAEACQSITERIILFSNLTSDLPAVIKTDLQTSACSSPLYKLAAVQLLAYLRTEATNHYHPHDNVLKFKKENRVASKSRSNLYLDLQNH